MQVDGRCVNLEMSAETGMTLVTLSFPTPERDYIGQFVDMVTRPWVVEIEDEEDGEDDDDASDLLSGPITLN